MFRVKEHKPEFPFEVHFRAPDGSPFLNGAALHKWLDQHVKWNGDLRIAHDKANGEGVSSKDLYYSFFVATMEDAMLVKMSC